MQAGQAAVIINEAIKAGSIRGAVFMSIYCPYR
jgi:hypothetical protein